MRKWKKKKEKRKRKGGKGVLLGNFAVCNWKF